MTPTLHASQWQCVAVVEVASDTIDFEELTADSKLKFRSRHADIAPHGFLWYEILVSATEGRRRTARTAWAILCALRNTADAGFVRGFRVVSGQHWLALGYEIPGSVDRDEPRVAEAPPARDTAGAIG
ncbi:MAG: hypothetical protein ABW186_10860 [Rhodanobacteraceae bacterium]